MIGLILAAGKNTRFKNKSKCLITYMEKPLVISVVNNVLLSCDYVYIVCNKLNINTIKEIFKYYDNVQMILDTKSDGTASTIERAIDLCCMKETVMICWSDIIFNVSYRFIEEELTHDLTIPVYEETLPYVSILVDERMQAHNYLNCRKDYALAKGLHDMSIFFLKPNAFKYIKQINSNEGEKDFLDIINIMYRDGNYALAVKTDDKLVESFNSMEEFREAAKNANNYIRRIRQNR